MLTKEGDQRLESWNYFQQFSSFNLKKKEKFIAFYKNQPCSANSTPFEFDVNIEFCAYIPHIRTANGIWERRLRSMTLTAVDSLKGDG